MAAIAKRKADVKKLAWAGAFSAAPWWYWYVGDSFIKSWQISNLRFEMEQNGAKSD